jgi:hypothetical protein
MKNSLVAWYSATYRYIFLFFWCISHIPNKTGSRNHELLLSFSRLAINQWLPTCTVGEIVSMEFAQFVALYVSGVPRIHGRKPCDSEEENLHFCHTLQARFKPKVHRQTCIQYINIWQHTDTCCTQRLSYCLLTVCYDMLCGCI